ncbi:SDR family NAD(P)-dependent oxidoreductase [Aromatoleum diolicum]|uniref:SDR family NAD(P)-dependent oxidoreductase n=1 Tax=Aromatoleum diolicum TaxID=75796 RepID=A0ABX1QHU2_9RHOO|nr:SDR family oxidoreductase [Aromatoleum diolicum]NMG77610.1 SDR family NAD(P)-dependent oxidoreductase [Aromatoleum diolicum]
MQKVAFVTGASRGIGRETAIAFARAGFDVAISARTMEEGESHVHALHNADGSPLAGSLAATADAIRCLGRKVLAVRMDLLDDESVKAAGEAVLNEFGRVDVLVNNAIYQGSDLNLPFLELEPATLQRMFQGYMMAPFLLSRTILPRMIEQGEGTVINVTSGAGESDPPVAAGRGGWGYAYGAGKAAVSRLSGILSVELGDRGIRAFTVNPGVVTTDALKATIGEKGVLALRNGSAPPEVPAAVMVWLATSPDAGRFQKRTIQVQPFALENGIVSDWRDRPAPSAPASH